MDDAKRMAQVFVELADTLVESFDVVDFLQTLTERCVELLDAAAAGLMLTDQRGGLKLMTATMERARLLEVFELQVQEGPCLECFSSGQAITNVELTEANQRWPTFTPAAVKAGFGATHALPMRLRGRVIGALNLFTDEGRRLGDTHVGVGQAMADVATIGLLHQRNTHEQMILSEQLQTALHSRVLVEQAKGALAARTGLSIHDAFSRMRAHARRSNMTLTDLASSVVDGSAPQALLVTASTLRLPTPVVDTKVKEINNSFITNHGHVVLRRGGPGPQA
ncbi:MAG: GAF and ANTAR domain-containing protein [Marmoricola sp.]